MKRILYLLTILATILPLNPYPQSVAWASQPPEENSGAVLCSPGVYLQTPDDCVPLGPSQYLTDNARLGMELPLRPLQISHPDPSLSDLPYNYYKVDPKTGTGFYPSLDAAISHSGGQTLPPGAFLFVVYTQRLDTDKGTYFLLPSGAYMPGDGSVYGRGWKFIRHRAMLLGL